MSLHLLHSFARFPQTAPVIALRSGDVFVTDNLLGYERIREALKEIEGPT